MFSVIDVVVGLYDVDPTVFGIFSTLSFIDFWEL